MEADALLVLDAADRADERGVVEADAAGISPLGLFPALLLDDLRCTFYAWLDRRDALRCSIDRAHVRSLRAGVGIADYVPVTEVEIAIYPRVSPEVARDPRVVDLVDHLTRSLIDTFRGALLDRLTSREHVVVVTHNGFIKCVLRSLMGPGNAAPKVANDSITEVRIAPSEVRIEAIGCVDHLPPAWVTL